MAAATRLAHTMVTRFGLGRRLSVEFGDVSRFGSSTDLSDGPTRADIDAILGSEFARAKSIITSKKAGLMAIAEALRDEKTLDGDRVTSLLAASCEEASLKPDISFPAKEGHFI